MALTVKAQEFQSSGTDMTSLLTNPGFESAGTGWTTSGGDGNWQVAGTAANHGYVDTNFMEDWTWGNLPDLDCHQTVTLDNGVYLLVALAHAIQQAEGGVVPQGMVLYANNDEVAVTTTTPTYT